MTTLFDTAWKKTAALLFAAPAFCFALSSGPGMPEYNDFESVDNTDLVNLATGDFSYSIPVMTVPGPGLGYPLNLSYHAGIQPEQEASWVGLGWNLQAGAITRQVNNIPDDFDSTLIEERIKSEHIHGWMASVSWNGATVGLSWDSEAGLGGMVGYSMQIKGTPLGIGATAGVNGVYEGVGVSMSVAKGFGDNLTASAGLSIGVHSKQGMTAGLNVGIGARDKAKGFGQPQTGASLASAGVSLSSRGGMSAGASAGVGISASTSVQAHVTQSSSNFFVPLWTPWTGYIQVSWGTWDVYIDGLQEDLYYGFLYSDSLTMGCQAGKPTSCYKSSGSYVRPPDCEASGTCPPSGTKRIKKMDFNNAGGYSLTSDTTSLKLGSTGEDIYSVQTQGISGTFRPYRAEDGDYYSYLSNQNYNYQEDCKGFTGSWFGKNCVRSGSINYGLYLEGDTTLPKTSGSQFWQSRDHHGTVYSRHSSVVWRFNEETGGALYTDPGDRDAPPTRATASKKITPLFDGAGRIEGWVLTAMDGVRYLYKNPQYNYVQQTLSGEDSTLKKWTRRETPYYAYAWLLSGILSPDHVRLTSCGTDVCLPEEGDLGGWVRFHYTAPKIVSWRSPVGPVSSASAFETGEEEGTTGRPKPESYTMTAGFKTVSYLSSVETPTHEALFEIEAQRSDGIPPAVDSMGYNADFSQSSTPTSTDFCAYDESGDPHKKQLYNTVIKIPTSGFDAETKVSLVARRYDFWTKWVFSNRQCRSGYRDEFLATVKLGDLPVVGANFEYTLLSSDIQHVRVVIGEAKNGVVSTPNLSYLNGIVLKSKVFDREVSAVRFGYDYSLAPNTPNSTSSAGEGEGADQGRLTLKTVTMGGGSNGPWNPPYRFSYVNATPYSADAKDYWGYYCATCAPGKRRPDGSANVWNLNKITTPSGGEIHVTYENKRIDFYEGMPSVVDGDLIDDYIPLTDSALPVFSPLPSTYAKPFKLSGVFDERYMREEIQAQFYDAKVVFLGRLDIAHHEDKNQPIFLEHLAMTGADRYVIETPRIYLEDSTSVVHHDNRDHYPALTYGMQFNPGSVPGYVLPSAPGSVNCPAQWRCEFNVGIVTASLADLAKPEFGHRLARRRTNHSGYEYTSSGSQTNSSWARVWAVYDDENPLSSDLNALTPYGGGVRVSKVSFREPFTNKENSIEYAYAEAASPTLPDAMSNYFLGVRYAQSAGERFYVGNPSVLHGKVTATYKAGGNTQYSTEYHFVTSKDAPVHIAKFKGTGGVHSRVKILDRSGIWGNLWKKVDKNSSGAVVRNELSAWASRITSDWRTKMGVASGTNLDIAKDGHTVLDADDASLKVYALNSTDSALFGVTQKLFGNRFIPESCEEIVGETDKNNCVKNTGASSSQIEHIRFAPLSRHRKTTQDALAKTTESNLFDYLTGIPLLEIQSNRKPDNSDEYYATLKSLAHHHDSDQVYAVMETKNMLSQEFGTTVFRFDSDPASKNFMNLSSDDRKKVVSSEFTHWDTAFVNSYDVQIRKFETFNLRDTAGMTFRLPTPDLAWDSRWRSAGKNIEYDPYGHLVEFLNPAKVRNAQIFGYGSSVPTAFAQNAARNQIHHQSFEVPSELALTGGTAAASPVRAYTGNNALRVRNCLEKRRAPASGTVTKSDCSSSNTYAAFTIPDLPVNVTYVASVWYYDEYAGSNPNNKLDSTLLKDSTQVTRPGLFIGKGSCYAQTFPNGVNHVDGHPYENGDSRASQRAVGTKNWKRLWVEFTPTSGCGAGSSIYLYANKGKPGSDVYYDELRVRPKSALMTSFAYDHRGNMISTADANEVPRHFNYDALGNLIGMRNRDNVLLSAQGKRNGDRIYSVKLENVGPKPDTTPNRPLFLDANDQPTTVNYELLSSSDTQIAWICGLQNKSVCTMDKSGSAVIQVKTDNGVHSIPFTVTGGQLGMDESTCELGTGGKNQCRFDIRKLTARLKARGDSARMQTLVLKFRFVNAGTAVSQIGCFDGLQAVNNLTGDDNLPCRAARAAHLRFNRFVDAGTDTLSPLDTALATILPNGVTVEPMMKSIDGDTSKYYTIIRNHNIMTATGLSIPHFSNGPNNMLHVMGNKKLGIEKSVAIPWSRANLLKLSSGDKHWLTFQLAYFTGSGVLRSACVSNPCTYTTASDLTQTLVSIYAY